LAALAPALLPPGPVPFARLPVAVAPPLDAPESVDDLRPQVLNATAHASTKIERREADRESTLPSIDNSEL
jgi:hypothetical protein